MTWKLKLLFGRPELPQLDLDLDRLLAHLLVQE